MILDDNGLNPLNTTQPVDSLTLYEPLRKPYFVDVKRIKIDERAPSVFIKAKVMVDGQDFGNQLVVDVGQTFIIAV